MSDKDGGSAFPAFERHHRFNEDKGQYDDRDVPVGGMSLRDYFAAHALIGLLASVRLATRDASEITNAAWKTADAMLKARVK